MTASTPKKNIVVLGASYTGFQAVESLVSKMHTTHRVVLVEKNSHAQHLFAFPRVSVVPGHERMVFIPFTTAFDRHPADSVAVVRGSATEILPDRVVLDKGDPIPYEFLVLATGTKLPPPGTLPSQDKMSGMRYLQQLQNRVAAAKDLAIVGGGAVGVQLATDIKDYYPTKNVTLVHSRDRLMHKFSPKMHEILMARMAELKINVVLADRAKIPQNGFPTDGTAFEVTLQSGRRLQADFAILSTGQVPLSDPIKSLSPSSISPSGFVSVKRTLQIADDRYPNVFAIGDVADTPNQKTARLGMHHAEVMAENILSLAQRRQPTSEYEDRGMGIHMSLGMTRDFKFRDPTPGEEPMVLLSDTGSADMKLTRIWERWAPGLTDYDL